MAFLASPVVIRDFPIPPSDNALKIPVRRYRKGGRMGDNKILTFSDSKEYISFKSAVNLWFCRHGQAQTPQFQKIKAWVAAGQVLAIFCDLRLHRETIWTKANAPKRYDAPNRLKALHDTLSKLIGIDDKVFFQTIIEKVEIPVVKMECFDLIIGPIKPRTEQL